MLKILKQVSSTTSLRLGHLSEPLAKVWCQEIKSSNDVEVAHVRHPHLQQELGLDTKYGRLKIQGSIMPSGNKGYLPILRMGSHWFSSQYLRNLTSAPSLNKILLSWSHLLLMLQYCLFLMTQNHMNLWLTLQQLVCGAGLLQEGRPVAFWSYKPYEPRRDKISYWRIGLTCCG